MMARYLLFLSRTATNLGWFYKNARQNNQGLCFSVLRHLFRPNTSDNILRTKQRQYTLHKNSDNILRQKQRQYTSHKNSDNILRTKTATIYFAQKQQQYTSHKNSDNILRTKTATIYFAQKQRQYTSHKNFAQKKAAAK